ncbi:MAG: class I SAM-dependent methyltransferase [Verrucomicrobiota bacterium]
MNAVRGIKGYSEAFERFCETTLSLPFTAVCKDFLLWLPRSPAKVLDVGSGIGQNAAALAEMGYNVTAIEPLGDFLEAARMRFAKNGVSWIQDSMPLLESIIEEHCFDFILVEGVWHHLNVNERLESLKRFRILLKEGGHCAISLRSGPAGAGKHLFPTDLGETIDQGAKNGFDCVFAKSGQPSILPNKTEVTWARVILHKKPDK